MMTTLLLNISLAILALLTSIAAIGGETWKKNEPRYLKRLTWRGWFSCLLLVATASLTVIGEKKIKLIHENENKQQNENMSNLKTRIQVSDTARVTAELRQQALLEQLINLATVQKEVLVKSQKETRKPDTSTNPKIASLENKITQYKEELQTVSKALSVISERKSSYPARIQPAPQSRELPVSMPEDHLKIVADSYHIQKKEAFLFQVERFSKGIWEPLFPQEVRIETSGKWYPIDGGPVPRFGLKGKGNIVLQITDLIKGGSTKCSVLFED